MTSDVNDLHRLCRCYVDVNRCGKPRSSKFELLLYIDSVYTGSRRSILYIDVNFKTDDANLLLAPIFKRDCLIVIYDNMMSNNMRSDDITLHAGLE